MKKLKIKQVILAAALAVGLGVTGAAETAQAADQCEHPEEAWQYQVTLVSYDTRDNNRFTHRIYIGAQYVVIYLWTRK